MARAITPTTVAAPAPSRTQSHRANWGCGTGGGSGGRTTPGRGNGPPVLATQKCASHRPTQTPTATAITIKVIAILRRTRQAYRVVGPCGFRSDRRGRMAEQNDEQSEDQDDRANSNADQHLDDQRPHGEILTIRRRERATTLSRLRTDSLPT
jgi:hypothetical protein